MNLPSSDHPIWALVRFGMVLGFAGFFMWQTASDFDKTEWDCLIRLTVAVFGTEYVINLISTRTRK